MIFSKAKIKDIVVYILSFIFRYTTRINKKGIIFSSWHGTTFNCNPKALAIYLSTYHKGEYDLFFLVTEPSDWKNENSKYPDIHFIKNGTLLSRYLLSTSKYIVANQWINLWNKRKKQVFIQTWHGSGPKKSDKDAINALSNSYINTAIRCCKYCDICISGNSFQTERFHKSYWYDGPVLECGTPRSDIYFMDNSLLKKTILQKYGIPNDSVLVLFAPTFRTDKNTSVYFNSSQIIETFSSITHKKCILLTRLHPAVSDQEIPVELETDYTKGVINVTRYPDIQDLLAISDFLITDYSSVSTEFLIQKKVCFLYVPDLNTFDRGLYFAPKDLPYSISETFDDLLLSIKYHNNEDYNKKIEMFSQKIGLCEKGTACKSVYEYIKKN